MSSGSFEKREREKRQRERAAAKRQRRADRTADASAEASADQGDVEALERFRLLSEAFAAGTIDREAYQAERVEILASLGLSDTIGESP